jgi:hypothetical protein
MVQLLRTKLNELQKQLEDTYSKEKSGLEKNEAWQRLKDEQKSTLTQKNSLLAPKKIKVATEEDIIDTLEEGSLEHRQTRIEAMPQRFQRAIEEAAKLLEPKASRISLPSVTIKNEADLEEWLNEVRNRVNNQLKDGPVIL